MPMVPLNAPSASENPRPRPRGNCKKLAERFRMEIKELMNQGQFYECDNRTWFCPSCQGLPTRAIITSCHHIYCEECFDSLDDGNGNSSGIIRECCICRVVITKAAFYGLFDDINSPTPGDSEADSDKPDGQKKRKAPHKEAKTHKRRRQGKSGTSFSEWTALNSDISMQDDSESESEDDQSGDSESTRETDDCSESGESQKSEEDSKEEDWMAKFGKSMPGAKFDAVRDQIQKWFAEDSTAKIVIFTLYLNTTKLLVSLCDQNNWKHARVSALKK